MEEVDLTGKSPLGRNIKKDKKLLAVIVFTIICFLVFGYVMLKLINENNECVNNPFVYTAEKTKDQGMPIICRCDSLNVKYASFTFDEYGVKIGNGYNLDTTLLGNFTVTD